MSISRKREPKSGFVLFTVHARYLDNSNNQCAFISDITLRYTVIYDMTVPPNNVNSSVSSRLHRQDIIIMITTELFFVFSSMGQIFKKSQDLSKNSLKIVS